MLPGALDGRQLRREQHRQLQQQEMLQQHHQAVAEEQQAQAAFCIGFHFSGDAFEEIKTRCYIVDNVSL